MVGGIVGGRRRKDDCGANSGQKAARAAKRCRRSKVRRSSKAGRDSDQTHIH